MPIGRISTPQAISIFRFNRTSQNPIYLVLETQFIEYETRSESDSRYMKAVVDYRNRIYNLKNYENELPFNRRARMDKFTSLRLPTDRHDTPARPPFQSCCRKRLNRQHRSLSFATYLETNIARLAYQREVTILDNWQQMLLQIRRCQGIA